MGNPEETEPEPPKDNNSIQGPNENSEQAEASQDSHIPEASQNPDPESEGNSSEQYYPATSESASLPQTPHATSQFQPTSPAMPQNYTVPSTSASQSHSSTAQVFSVPRSSPTAPSHYSPSVQLYDLDRARPSTSSASQYRQSTQASDIPRSTAGPSTSQYSPEMELYDLDQAGPSTSPATHYSYDIVNPSEGPSTSSASQFNYDVYQSPQAPGTSTASSNVAKCQMFEVPETNKFKKPRPPMRKTSGPKSALEMATPEMIEKMTCGSVSNLPANRNLRDESDISGEEGNGVTGLEGSQPRPGTKVYLDQERFLPIANVVRIMKSQMDPQAKLAKDAKECVQECVSEFICFIASEAAALCAETKRKTITADDLLTALEATGFNNFAEPMRIFLQKYRQQHKITGPIHRVHPNYCRPKQFLNDPPVPPLFFDSPSGRRGTETQYVTNGHEIIKTAPFHTEWNELTGMPNSEEREEEEEVEEVVDYIDQNQIEPMEEMEMEDDGMEQDPLGAIALEQQGQMQIYVDPKSKQHYAAKETPNGMELYPLIIQDTPLQLESVPVPSNFVINTEEEPVLIQRDAHMAPSPDMNIAGPSNPRKRQNPAPLPVRRNRQLDEEDDEEEIDDGIMEEMPGTPQYHREQYTVQHQQYRRQPIHQQQNHQQQRQHQHHQLNNHPQRHRPAPHHQQELHQQQPQVQESRFEAIRHPEDVIPPRVLPQPPHRSLPRAVPLKTTPQRAAAPRRAVPPRVASQKTTPPKPGPQKTPPKRSPAKKKK
ncbi:unnamed protein product [Caenorhabditis brenneri]